MFYRENKLLFSNTSELHSNNTRDRNDLIKIQINLQTINSATYNVIAGVYNKLPKENKTLSGNKLKNKLENVLLKLCP